jgi:hypothetical protein
MCAAGAPAAGAGPALCAHECGAGRERPTCQQRAGRALLGRTAGANTACAGGRAGRLGRPGSRYVCCARCQQGAGQLPLRMQRSSRLALPTLAPRCCCCCCCSRRATHNTPHRRKRTTHTGHGHHDAHSRHGQVGRDALLPVWRGCHRPAALHWLHGAPVLLPRHQGLHALGAHGAAAVAAAAAWSWRRRGSACA